LTVKAGLFAGCLAALCALAPARARAAAYPFPQNQAQPVACYYPNYLNSDVQAVYNSWLTQQVTTTGAGGFRRVRRHGDPTLQADSTVSEGIGYGMVIAVYMNDQALFDDLWRYYNLHLGGNGLMDWYISADGTTVLGSGGASDADQDVAWALCMAIYQWGTPTFGGTYAALANSMITKLYNNYVDGTTHVFGPWGGAGNTVNISYFDPSEYRVFAQVSGNSGWLNVVDACYTALFNALNATNGNANNGLVPAWSTYAGVPSPGFSGAPIHFQYDSCRTPFRIGKDWYFFGEPRAKQYLDKINSFYGPLGAIHITDGYDLNGAPRPQYDASGTGANGQSAAFVSPAMQASMDDPSQAAFTQAAYDAVKTNTLLIGGPYYDQCWTVQGMLWASGNFLNYMPTPTPTPTVDACQTRIRVNAGGAAQGGYSADKAYAAGSWGYVPAFAGAVGTSAGPVTGDPNPGLYLDERYDSSGTGEVRYSFTLPNGPATVTLSWAETYFSSAGQRQMDVFIGGTQVENNLDIYAAAGGKNKALIKSYATTVSGGVLTIRFVTVMANATIHAIEVTSGALCSPTVSPTRTPVVSATPTPTRTPSFTASPSFTISPTGTQTATPYPTPDACAWTQRVNCGGTAFTGAGGLVWAADKAYSAGSYGYVSYAAGAAGTSAGPIAGTTDDALFMAERYGNPVRYRFDLPNGLYQVRVRLAETYFSSAGQRNESLTANGTTILNAVDLFTWAGGLNVARDQTFYVTVAGGNLQIEAFSSNNNGTLQAIEVLGLSGCTPTPTPSATQSPAYTPTVSPTQSPSRTATATATQTRTASASPSMTASASPSATGTATLSASPSRTATVSASTTATRSASPSPSATASGTPTLSPAPTQTATGTPSPTRSPSFTASPTPQPGSPTVSPTGTPSFSATATRSASPSPSGTVSASRTATLTGSPSATLSASPTVTPSVSRTASPTASPSFSASPTLSITLSSSPTPTPVPTGSSPTRTPTLSPSFSASPTATRSATPSESATLTASATPTPSASPSASPPPTATATPSASPVPTLAPTSTASPSLTASPAVSATASPTTGVPPSAGGDPIIDEHHAWPSPLRPQGGWVSVKLRGDAGALRLRCYSVNWVLIGTVDGPGAAAGWARVALPPAFLQDLASGTYYYVVEAQGAGAWKAAQKPGRWVFIR
jgi:endo-1,4-beta-D-glucanase Y